MTEIPLIEKMKEAHEQLVAKLLANGVPQEKIAQLQFNSALPTPQLYYAPTDFEPRIPVNMDVLSITAQSSTDPSSIRESIETMNECWGERFKEQFLAEGGTEEEWEYLTDQSNFTS